MLEIIATLSTVIALAIPFVMNYLEHKRQLERQKKLLARQLNHETKVLDFYLQTYTPHSNNEIANLDQTFLSIYELLDSLEIYWESHSVRTCIASAKEKLQWLISQRQVGKNGCDYRLDEAKTFVTILTNLSTAITTEEKDDEQTPFFTLLWKAIVVLFTPSKKITTQNLSTSVIRLLVTLFLEGIVICGRVALVIGIMYAICNKMPILHFLVLLCLSFAGVILLKAIELASMELEKLEKQKDEKRIMELCCFWIAFISIIISIIVSLIPKQC